MAELIDFEFGMLDATIEEASNLKNNTAWLKSDNGLYVFHLVCEEVLSNDWRSHILVFWVTRNILFLMHKFSKVFFIWWFSYVMVL